MATKNIKGPIKTTSNILILCRISRVSIEKTNNEMILTTIHSEIINIKIPNENAGRLFFILNEKMDIPIDNSNAISSDVKIVEKTEGSKVNRES